MKRDVILFCWDIQYLGDVSGPCFDLIPILEDESWPLRPDLQLESHLWSRDRHSCVSSAGQMWKHVLPSLLSATHAFPCLALTCRDIFVDHFRLAMATEHNLPGVLRQFYNNPWHCLKHLSPIVDRLLTKRKNKWNWSLMHVVSVNNLILFFSCGHGHFCSGVVSWWGDIIREGLKKKKKFLRLCH